MKIHILFDFSDFPSGGGNQFLKALKQYFLDKNLYAESADSADLILFNSHHLFDDLIGLKRKFPKKIFVQRVDGPMSLYRGVSLDSRDHLVALANEFVADATIFQSSWSRVQNHICGVIKPSDLERVIINAPSPLIFNHSKEVKKLSKKIRIISTSWSNNKNKGFDDYNWLDENLDFDRYKFTFIGNSPIKFRNIEQLPPMSPSDLAVHLKGSDIFITASRYESCSNALLEALHCGIPAIAFKGSSNVEIVANSGLLYSSVESVPFLLEKLTQNYTFFRDNIKLPSINDVGDDYLMFFNNFFSHYGHSEFKPKKLGLLRFARLYFYYEVSKLSNLFNILKRFR